MKWLMRVLGVIWGGGGVAIFLIYLSSQKWDWDWKTGWSIIAACATWVLAGGIFFVFWQITEARRSTDTQLKAARLSTNAQIAVELFKELRKEKILKTLRKIYRTKPEDLKSLLNISEEEENRELRDGIEEAVDWLELLGALVAQEIFDTKIAIEAYSGSTVLRCWYKLKEYIEEARKQRGGLYCKYLEDFAWRTWDYQSRKSPQKEHIRFYQEKPSESFDLVQHLNDNPTLQPKEADVSKLTYA